MTIDAHHHLWTYDAERYPWIGDRMDVLKRDFSADDFSREMDAADVDGAVTVQARHDVAETEWLMDVARESPDILGVVGWVDLTSDSAARELDRLAQNPILVGIRHAIQDELEERFALREDFNRGVALLQEHGLAYDILIYERHLPHAIEFVDRHPGQIFILDHVAKPRICDGEIEVWQRHLTELARRPNCYCKLSGLLTEADWLSWRTDDIRPYLDAALEAFGPPRLMFGSDWPVCLLACSYGGWIDLMRAYLAPFTATERARIWGETAAEAYGLVV